MSIENIGAYSPDTVYGQLTTPFLDKKIQINAHTPFDQDEEVKQTFSKNDFEKNISEKVFPTFEEMTTFEEEKQVFGVPSEQLEFPPKMPSISTFQASNTKTSSEWVNAALKNGYSANKAVLIGKAYSTYSKVVSQEKTPDLVTGLVNQNYIIK